MIIGDKSVFAVESGITKAYWNLGLRALGFFQIHINNSSYGVHSPEATLLGCSFDQVQNRIGFRGKHTASFATTADAGIIADSFIAAEYSPDHENAIRCGMPKKYFNGIISSSKIVFAPDGDEAFDDGSYILQFDVADRVRIIAFKSTSDYRHNPTTLSDLWLDAELFYGILKDWHTAFQVEWSSATKID